MLQGNVKHPKLITHTLKPLPDLHSFCTSHGSIWGVPPFLEGIFRATISTTMTTSYFYSFISTTSYRTRYIITVQLRQSRYSLMREW
jgi:hypothetical protein